MLLRVTDGTTTVTISVGGASLGVTYFPDVGAEDEETIGETVTLTLEGNDLAIREVLGGVERLLSQAGANLLAPVFVEFRPTDSGDVWRSRLKHGRVRWSEAPGRRRLGGSSNIVEVAVLWERVNFWEGPEVELSLSSSSMTIRTGGVAVYNDDNVTEFANWMQITAAQALGAMPAPVRLRLMNDANVAVGWKNVYVGNNAFSDPANLDPFLLGSEAVNGATASWTGSVTHATPIFVWALGSTLLSKTKGAMFHPVLALTSVSVSGVYLKLQIGSYIDGVFEAQRSSREIFCQYGEELVDFGLFPIAPGGYGVVTENAAITVSARYASGNGTIVADCLHLMATDGWRHLRQVAGYTIDDGDSWEDDGIDGGAYALDGVSGAQSGIVKAYGEPLTIWPGVLQRVHVLCDEGVAFVAGRAMVGRMWLRPRYRTVS